MMNPVRAQQQTQAPHFNVQFFVSVRMTRKTKKTTTKKTTVCATMYYGMNKICNVKLYLLQKEMCPRTDENHRGFQSQHPHLLVNIDFFFNEIH